MYYSLRLKWLSCRLFK